MRTNFVSGGELLTTTNLVLVEWYWDEITYEYDDDAYSTEYWDYDWESVWGEYAYVALCCFVTTDGCAEITHLDFFILQLRRLV